MTKENFYTLLGELDGELICSAAHPPAKRRSAVLLRWAAAAACVCLIAAGAVLRYAAGRAKPPAEDSSAAETAVESGAVSIYYTEGGEIVSRTEYLPLTPQAVFNCWREANGIGEEVRLLHTEIRSNGTEYTAGESAAGYSVGDTFTYCITVSKELAQYCTGAENDPLPESLKRTMTGYGYINYSEFILNLE
ncbi:MAG: hypothetical protein IKS42_10615 [Oscillospiraceae bacterium]|nr:hypothetical protein [Oscillospiraceae bacterium]